MPREFKNKRIDVKEEIKLDISVGDVLLFGKFKNKRIVVKTIGKDDLGQPTINGMSLLKMRIEKLLPVEKQSKETREEATMKKEAIKITKTQLKEMIQRAVNEQVEGSEAIDVAEVLAVLEEVERLGRWPRLHRALADNSPATKNLMRLAAERLEEAARHLRELMG